MTFVERCRYPLVRVGGRLGCGGSGDPIENTKISCPCRESNSNAHVIPSVWQSINTCTGWFLVHTYHGISNNTMTQCRGEGVAHQNVWRHTDASLQHRRSHNSRDFFTSPPCICISVRTPQCEEFVLTRPSAPRQPPPPAAIQRTCLATC